MIKIAQINLNIYFFIFKNIDHSKIWSPPTEFLYINPEWISDEKKNTSQLSNFSSLATASIKFDRRGISQLKIFLSLRKNTHTYTHTHNNKNVRLKIYLKYKKKT